MALVDSIKPVKAAGCAGCGSPDTVTIDGRCGRRCADCPPTFDATHAVELQRRGGPGAAMAYVRAWSA